MQQARPALALLFILAVAAACATSTSEPEPVGGASDAGATVDAAKPDAGQPAKTCVTTCKVDSECANSCPAVTSGSNCCDTGTNVCFRSASASCPVPTTPPDGGPPPSY